MDPVLPFLYLNIQSRKHLFSLLVLMKSFSYSNADRSSHEALGLPLRNQAMAVCVCLMVLGAGLIPGMRGPEAMGGIARDALASMKPKPDKFPLVSPEETSTAAAEPEALPRIHLLVTGEPEAGKVLTFFLHPFEKRFHYYIYFGDGSKQMAMARNRHLYQEPGNYRIRVLVIDQGDTLNDQAFSLYIRPTVAVMADYPRITDRPVNNGILPREQGTLPATKEVSQPEVRIFDHGSWQETPEANRRPQPLMFADEMPSFPGGMQALQRFLNRHISYPTEARTNVAEGKVVVQFVVQADGQLADIQFVKELGYGCEEAVLHALALMPPWIPGRHEGQTVPVYYVLPVSFILAN
jgi:TonB family protein